MTITVNYVPDDPEPNPDEAGSGNFTATVADAQRYVDTRNAEIANALTIGLIDKEEAESLSERLESELQFYAAVHTAFDLQLEIIEKKKNGEFDEPRG